MIPNTSFNVANVQVSTLGGVITQIEGYFRGATADRWLQVHASCVTPAAGAVPMWQIPIYQTTQFFENLQYNAVRCKEGIFIGISTTEGSWTASADTMDVTVFTKDAVSTATVSGDWVTGVAGLTAWADDVANANKKLLRVQAMNNLGADAWLQVFFKSPNNGDVPVLSLPFLDTGVAQSFQFSNTGLSAYQQEANSTPHYGCYIRISTTGDVLTTSAASNYIRATVK